MLGKGGTIHDQCLIQIQFAACQIWHFLPNTYEYCMFIESLVLVLCNHQLQLNLHVTKTCQGFEHVICWIPSDTCR